ncbi:winged helix-turn-helix domain-containing protein [Methanobrevibacter sp.]
MTSLQKTLYAWNLLEIKDKELLNFLVGREGGKTSIMILDLILQKPYNKNQLARQLGLDYNTVTYHIKIMCAHNYITSEKFEKSVFYYPTEKFNKVHDEYTLLKEYVLNK